MIPAHPEFDEPIHLTMEKVLLKFSARRPPLKSVEFDEARAAFQVFLEKASSADELRLRRVCLEEATTRAFEHPSGFAVISCLEVLEQAQALVHEALAWRQTAAGVPELRTARGEMHDVLGQVPSPGHALKLTPR